MMTGNKNWDVVIVGGSYAGLSAAMALGRSRRSVLIIDSGKPCNKQTPHAHNLITQDGQKPAEITRIAKEQVLQYDTVQFVNDWVSGVTGMDGDFEIQAASGSVYHVKKLLFTTGVTDIMQIEGFAECWGISALHCPFCHGYEVRDAEIGLIGNGDLGFELCKLISNWSKNLTLFTNGESTLTNEQKDKIDSRNIRVVEQEIEALVHEDGYLQKVILKDGVEVSLSAVFAKPKWQQQCAIPEEMGCEMTEHGYVKTDDFYKTTVAGVYAAGDNVTMFRSLSQAIAGGSKAGAMVCRELVAAEF